MRCSQCGNSIPAGTAQCPVCGARQEAAQTREDPRYDQPYPLTDQKRGTPPGDSRYGYAAEEPENAQSKYATPAFHTYRKQMFTGFPQQEQAGFQGHPREGFSPGGGFAKALSDLPQVIGESFDNPMGALQGMIRRGDRFTGGMAVMLSLIFAFFAGMILTKGVLGSLIAAMSGLTGLQLADSAASLNQGASYLAGKVAVPIGGIAAVSQLIAAMVPAAVAMVYLSVMRQVRFSFLLLSGFTAIITLPNLLALVLASVCGLISPYLSLMVLVFGQIYGYVLLCTMTVRLAGLKAGRAVPAQALLICLSEFTKLILIAVIGGLMMNGVIQTLTSLTNSMGGLL